MEVEKNFVGSMSQSRKTIFATYARLWCCTESLLHIHDPFLAPHRYHLYVQAVLFTLAFARPSRHTVAAAMAARIIMYWIQLPRIWDSCVWSNATDLVFVITCLLVTKAEDVLPICGEQICVQMGLFYIGAGFWKLNTSFLNPLVSCSSIYVASLLAFLPAPLTPAWFIRPALASAPLMTIFGELALGVSLLLPYQSTRRVGVVLAALLHYAIAITPHPNQVAAFGVFCVTRLFVVMPESWSQAIRESLTVPSTPLSMTLRLVALTLICASVQCTSTPGVYIDWCIPCQTALCLIGARAVALDVASPPSTPPPPPVLPPGRAALVRYGRWLATLLTAFYVFGFQLLGLMDISATSPFSHIRQHGGSNHLLVPTSLLLQWPQSAAHIDAFHGGIVRVAYTTSESLNALYPADGTDELQPRIVDLLTTSGHIARQFTPTVQTMLGHAIRTQIPHWTPASGRPFGRYTLPAVQLRRMLADARAHNESFELRYEHLPGVVGDEAWRRTAIASQVHVREDGRGGISCRVRPRGKLLWTACAPDELALLPPPTGPLLKILLWFPYPILDELEGSELLPCMD